MTVNKLVLGYYALLFIAFGFTGLVQPELIADLVHLNFQSELGYLDFVAMYGGLFLGNGVFMLYCLKENIKLGLVNVLCTMGFMLAARSFQYVSTGEVDLVQIIYFSGEAFTVMLICLLLYIDNSKSENEDET